MTIDNNLDLDCIYAAKGFSKYLSITVPELPKEWKKITWGMRISEAIVNGIEKIHSAYLFITDKERYHANQESIKANQEMLDSLLESRKQADDEHLQDLAKNGLVSREEQDSWLIADFASYRFGNHLQHNGCEQNGDLSLETNRQTIDTLITQSVQSGIMTVNSKYWIPIKGVETPEIINPEFKGAAVYWFRNEVYSRLDTGKEFGFLDHLKLQECEGVVRISYSGR